MNMEHLLDKNRTFYIFSISEYILILSIGTDTTANIFDILNMQVKLRTLETLNWHT